MSDAPDTEIHASPFGGLEKLARRHPVVRFSGGSLRVESDATVGSSDQVDLVLDAPTVSRLHARLELRDDGLWIEDLGSRNGVYVEGVLVQRARLHDGARVTLGGTELRVEYEPEPTSVELWPTDRFGPLLGRSPRMRQLFARLAKAASSEATVLVTGETGTGKELVATALHEASARVSGPLRVVDCGAMAESLLESELFGHARGAFTGAAATRQGLLESSAGGTVFLDEIGELPMALQPKLLRALESRTVRRLGENESRPIDVRFVAATLKDLRTMVNDGAFREDLYFRLAVLTVDVPPLRERLDDLEPLLAEFAASDEPPSPELLRELRARAWRGNVRELRNFVERAEAFGSAEALDAMASARALPGAASGGDAGSGALPLPDATRPFHEVRERWVAHVEREYLRQLLAAHESAAAAARAAGLNRTFLYRLLKKHGLSSS